MKNKNLVSLVLLVLTFGGFYWGKNQENNNISEEQEVNYYLPQFEESTIYHNEQLIDEEAKIYLGIAVEVKENQVINFKISIISNSYRPYVNGDQNIKNLQADAQRFTKYIVENNKIPRIDEIQLSSLDYNLILKLIKQLNLPEGVEFDGNSIKKYQS